MFMFRKQKPFVLSKTNSIPLHAIERVIQAYHASHAAPLFNLHETFVLDATNEIEPFSSVVDAEGGKVHLCILDGHFEADGIGARVTHPFSAELFVRLYESGKTPTIAYEGLHEVVIEGRKYRIRFKTPFIFKYAYMKGEQVVGSWCYSHDLVPLSQVLGTESKAYAVLSGLRITRLEYLRNHTRSQLLERAKDEQVVKHAEKIMSLYGLEFSPE